MKSKLERLNEETKSLTREILRDLDRSAGKLGRIAQEQKKGPRA